MKETANDKFNYKRWPFSNSVARDATTTIDQHGWKCAICAKKLASNVTGRHRGPKRKLRAGYRAPSRRRHAMCRHSIALPNGRPWSLRRTSYFSSSSVWHRAISLRYVCIQSLASFSSPRLPLCKISFLSRPPLLRLPVEKNCVLNQSPNHSLTRPAYPMCQERKLSLRNQFRNSM